jgi:hypothetical protein
MSLHVYENVNELPNGITYIKSNDSFFDAGGIIRGDEFSKNVLSRIDGSEYCNESSFYSKFVKDKVVSKDKLSTGAKTLINIYDNPNYCFDTCECGNNALKMLFEIRDGYVLWRKPVVCADKNYDCDIIFEEKQYTKAFDFLEATMGRYK